MNKVIDLSTLTWVKKELDETLKEARQSLEAHVDNPQDHAQIGFLAAHLHQVYGTLQMVELYGASLLAEEMESVATALGEETISKKADACEVLMRAILQLPDYLDRLIAGARDIPLVLLPILNDLRAVRGENLLSENAMFSPDLGASLPEGVVRQPEEEFPQVQVKELRHRFQLGLLGWLRENRVEESLITMESVLEELQDHSACGAVARLWWVAGAVVASLKDKSLTSNVSIVRLLGQVDRQIKRMNDEGESALDKNPALDLFKNLLFYVAQVHSGGQKVTEIQNTYRLRDLVPDDKEMAEARESMAGQNADLYATVASAVKEELARLKDSLDLVLRSAGKDLEDLAPLTESLRSLGDTLGMLGLDAPRKAIVAKATDLSGYKNSGNPPPETLLMDIAGTLLLVESSVDGMGAGRAIRHASDEPGRQLAQSEFDQVMDVVFQEAINDLVRGKEAIVAYTETDHDASAVESVPQLFNQVKGGLLLLGETRAAALIGSAARYVQNELCQKDGKPSQTELDSLADAVCGLEYYLEGRREHRMYGNTAMNVAEQSIEKLGYPASETEDVNALEPEQPVIQSAPCSDAGHVAEAVDELSTHQAPETGQLHAEADEHFTIDLEADLPEFPGELVTTSQAEGGLDVSADGDPQHADSAPEVAVQSPGSDGTEAHLPEAEGEVVLQGSSVDVGVVVAVPEQVQEKDDLPIIGEEVDEEILEIFIEEAEEEIGSISAQLPVWIGNSEDKEALGTVRRSFHTLKGSGRLVGAMRIGEFAWAFENMLNRVIEGVVSASPSMITVLQAALTALPELVRQIKDGTPVRQPVAHLVHCAEALSKGEALPVPAPEPMLDEAPEAVIEPALGLEATTLPIDEPTSTAGEIEVPPADGVMDSMLYEIFNTESHGHLEIIHHFLGQADGGEAKVNEDFVRALHTLHGSAHMANAGAIADLSGELERYAKALVGADVPMSLEGCNALRESACMIEQMLASLPMEMSQPERLESLLEDINRLRESAPAPSAGSAALHDADANESGSCDACESIAAQQSACETHDPYAELDQELLEIFLEESEENLEASDAALHGWREGGHPGDSVGELQRALHTLKGGARMADLPQVGDLAHAMETLIESVAERRFTANATWWNTIQRAHDQLVLMLDSVRARHEIEAPDALIDELERLVDESTIDEAVSTDSNFADVDIDTDAVDGNDVTDPGEAADPYAETDPELLEVFLEEAGDILEHSEETLRAWRDDPENTSLMAELQRELHTMKGGARMADITEIGDLAHAIESLMVKVSHREVAATPSLFAVLEQAQDCLSDMIQHVSKREPIREASVLMVRLETLQDGGEVTVTAGESAANRAPEEDQVAEVVVTRNRTEHRDRRAKTRDSQELVRVKAKLLDNMVNYAGEVSIYRSRLEQQIGAFRFNLVEMEQTVSRLREQLRKLEIETEAQILFRYETEADNLEEQFDPLEMDRYSQMQQLSRSLVESVSDLGSIQALLENITGESETLLLQQSRVNTELQEGLMRTRMVPFLGLAARMRRIVRQTCQATGKKAELELSGAEGEMDRTVVDRIIAPIEHMLRNAISHGIETPEHRCGKGKSETGTIRITLERESSDVVLKIADDGAGINLAAIRKKAVERGLMKADSAVTDTEVLQFILETGFSTAEKVTQVAGRGVGMDVVNSEVKQLGGSLHIDSREGQGTTFTVRLPFTLALNQALLIEVGEDTYAVPLSSIEGIVRMPRADLKNYYDDPDARFAYGGHEYEVRHLGTLLGTGKPHIDSGPKRIPVLLARVGEHCMAFQVENLMGSREIVVKSVGPQISTVRGVSGATILGDGRVVMILDLPAMLRSGIANPMLHVEEIFNRPVRTRGLTVMVVDDSITVRKVTTRLLERNDMNVIAAKDGVDAVSKLQENIPDIMLLDIEMPRMDGFELATHVRNEARLKNIPIIMITSRTGDKHRQRAMQIGVNRYLGKPFQETELLENIKSLLQE